MSQGQSIEEIMQRIRAQVRASQAGGAIPAAGPGTTPPVQAPAAVRRSSLPVNLNASNPKLHDLSRLQLEVSAALDGHRQVGQLNPRLPGLRSDAIQFAKKAMRRSLTWYTRPLHLFGGAVIRALQQVTTVLQSHEGALRTVSQELAALRAEVRTLREELHETASDRGKYPESKA